MTTKDTLSLACAILRGDIATGDSASSDHIMLLRSVRDAIEDGERVQCSGKDLAALLDCVIDSDED